MQKLAGYIYRIRKWVLMFWIFAIFLFGIFALKLPSVLGGNGFEYKGDYNETRKILEKDFGQAKSSIILVFEKDKAVSDMNFKNFIDGTFKKLTDFDGAEKIISPYERDGMIKDHYAYGILTFNKNAEGLGKEIAELKDLLKNKQGLKVTMTGEPIIVQDLNAASQEDLAKAEMIGLPIALVVLVLAFGSLVAASLPLVIGIISILITMGTVYFFSYGADLSIFILNIVPMIGLALSIDFALLFINRYKEELQSKSIQEAIEITIATAGRSIIFSGLCVFIGLSGLWFIQIDIFQNVALGGMTVVLISALCALTFLPALLAIIGKNINKLSVLRISSAQTSIWHKFAQFVMRRPVLMAAAALAILLIGLLPVKQMTLSIPGTDSLPPKYPSRLAIETYKEHFIAKDKRDEKKVTIVLETNGNVLKKNNLKKVTQVVNELEKDRLVHSVDSPFSATGAKDGEQLLQLLTNEDKAKFAPVTDHFIRDNKMLLEVYLKTGEHSTKARQWVNTWSNEELGLKASFGGRIKFEQEIFTEIVKKAPYGLLLIVISTLIILMAAFRSVLIPVKAILMNVLSLGCTFGIVVWVFQEGHFGMTPATIGLILPVFVFSLVFGLSMDYEVFLISRIQEFYLKTGDNSAATISGLTYTSKIITSAAAIMIVVTGAFAFTGVMPIKQLGVGIAAAIFIDATIVRMVLVPALMKLLGDWNWWFFGYENKKQCNSRKKPA
ncbi:MMPL family transporter [Neobacillus vireti]|uniref:MmpL family transporter n=1 Tax=Neobacillus vireti LMG 21834 TaxID=1131730 RepID=A0AB94IKN5_9BACI|nr:MMPL family transporter [Neobacillus vireti]ETI67641.1 MmpL family transporter [Neobacillus vireti LMG 21834]KLT19113.1 membrane protein [Neobacillus vireti]